MLNVTGRPLKAGIVVAAVLAVGLGAVMVFGGQKDVPAPDKEQPENMTEKPVEDGNETELVYAVHWVKSYQINGTRYENGSIKEKGLKQYVREYEETHPNIDIKIKQIEYGNYANRLETLHKTGQAPDIYQIYSTWGPSYVRQGMLDEPPADIKEDVRNNYITTAGVTINNTIWGVPTEVNDYALLYNKEILREAGVVDENGNADPPETWSELIDVAVKTTKTDEQGNIKQYGFAFLRGQTFGVVDPYLSLAYSNNAQYVSDDYTHCRINSSAGVEALKATTKLFEKNATTLNADMWEFGEQKNVAMVIAAPWTEGTFREGFGNKFDKKVGVAPVPYMEKPASLQYSWFMGVMNQSEHKEEAWNFLRWFATDVREETGTTRYGDLLARNIGAIPSRRSDIENNQDVLNTSFKSTYVEQLNNSVPEPTIMEASNAKGILMNEIQSAWSGEKTEEEALDSACRRINSILSRQYQ
ncbi:MAG: extracellular solute-binding protein [Candidatus Nanohalobium sp.]